MSAVAATDYQNANRLRLDALLLMAWQDVGIKGSRVKGDSGSGDPTTITGRTSTKRRDELLLRLNRAEPGDEPGSVVEMEAERNRHPAFTTLADAMAGLRRTHPGAHRLLYRQLVGRCSTSALMEAHALVESTMARFPLRTALISLDRLLPANMVFPRPILEAEAAFEHWLSAVRPQSTRSGRTVAARISPGAQAQRILYAQTLSDGGMAQADIAKRLGVDQSSVSRMLRRVDITESFTFPNTPAVLREKNREATEAEHRRTSPRFCGGATVKELQAVQASAERERQALKAGLDPDEAHARDTAWAMVAKARGW